MAEKKFIPVKVTDREWAEKLLDGEVFMRPLYEFGAWNLKKEDKQLNNSFRGDLCEGMSGIFGEVEECPIYDSFDLTPVKLQIGNIRDIAYAIPIENFLKLLIPRYIPLRFPMRELYESQSNYDKLVSNTRSIMKNHKSPFVRPMLVIDGNARVTDEGILI